MKANIMTQNQSTRKIEIYETTLRDGAQGSGMSLSLSDKLQIARRLDELGVDFIEGGFPMSNPKDKAFFDEIRNHPLRQAKVVAFGMTRRKGIAADSDLGLQCLLDSETPVVTIVGKSWDLHVRDVLKVQDAENLAMIEESVAFIVAGGRDCFFDAEHFFDGWVANREFALQALQAADRGGASRRLPDAPLDFSGRDGRLYSQTKKARARPRRCVW